MMSDEFHQACAAFVTLDEVAFTGAVKVVGENGSGWRAEVIVTHCPDPRAQYEWLVTVLHPINRAHGFNTFDPHLDYVMEKFIGDRLIGDDELALIHMSITTALRYARERLTEGGE